MVNINHDILESSHTGNYLACHSSMEVKTAFPPPNYVLSNEGELDSKEWSYRLMLSNKLVRLFSSVIRTSRGFAPCAAPTIPIRSIWSIRRPARL